MHTFANVESCYTPGCQRLLQCNKCLSAHQTTVELQSKQHQFMHCATTTITTTCRVSDQPPKDRFVLAAKICNFT